MIYNKTILFIGDPYCIHNLKWISYFSARNKCLSIGAINDYTNKTTHTEAIAKKNNITIFEEPLPQFSVKNIFGTRKGIKRLNRVIEHYKVDFVHIMYANNIPWGYKIKKPMVLTTRGSDVLIDLPHFFRGYNGAWWSWIYRKAARKLQFVTCTSHQQTERFKTLFPAYPPAQVHVVRTGVNVEEIEQLGKELRVVRDRNRIFLPRYVAPNYNNELILQAVLLLPENLRKELTLVMISPLKTEKKYVDMCMALAHSTGCKIELKEEMNQRTMWAEYFKCGLAVMTPKSDGTPNTALEALSASCPLVIPPLPYDTGLFEDVCFRLNSFDAGELKNILEAHLEGRLPDLSQAALERVRREGNRPAQMEKLSGLYEKYLDIKPDQTCVHCVLSTADVPGMTFNSDGFCSYCLEYDRQLGTQVVTGELGMLKWSNMVAEIKAAGKNKEYDCVLGVSGGSDSTYLALKAKEAGLRVLCVHLDNGWNSREATSNITNIIRKLEFKLYTHVVEWEEFKDVQLSYFKAGVLDLDVPTDHAMLACLYQQAIRHKSKYILSGHNYVTEAILPANFNFDKGDAQNLINIHQRFGKIPLRTFPLFRQKEKLLVSRYYKLKSVRPLNWINYNKEEAKKEISEKLGWKPYGAKHFENIFTRFYQGYILPTRFHIDKRKAHLSTLICSGQLTREQALDELKKPQYDPGKYEIDRAFVLNKFNLDEEQFEQFMTMPVVPHEEYGVEIPWSHYIGLHYLKRKRKK
jgi:N-acetyl sugar amidotransferase